MPKLFIIAGPNGAGKSTSAPQLLSGLRRVDEFVNADVIASRSLLGRIKLLQRSGYRCHLAFFWLPNADMAVQRVAQRVATGGHDIPKDVVRRRYERGLENLFGGYAAAVDSWTLFDNTASVTPRRIAWRIGGGLRIDDNRLWSQLVSRYVKPRAEEPFAIVPAELPEDLQWQQACDPEEILAAVARGVAEAIDRHRARGEPIVVWLDGKVVWLQPGEY